MKKLGNFFAHLSIALSLVLITVFIFNGFNPRMGFLHGTPALVLACCTGAVGVLTGIIALCRFNKQ